MTLGEHEWDPVDPPVSEVVHGGRRVRLSKPVRWACRKCGLASFREDPADGLETGYRDCDEATVSSVMKS